ncbi:MAG: hypothetical protein JWM37_735 [Candidatus Saccharibacteria bacterium]|nr:hypothetical protein [Candidatus Saccharibacteria bacterium]
MKFNTRYLTQTIFVLVFGMVGVSALIISHAASSTVATEAENGTLSNCVTKVKDASASGGTAVQFGTCAPSAGGNPPAGGGTTSPVGSSSGPGAHLPISYSLSSLTGTVRYVATNGSDTNPGSAKAPFATLSKAISASAANDSIVVRGGTYRIGNLAVSKSLKIYAYPGEIPVFNGAQSFASGWTTSGSLSSHSYAPKAATDGSGISFTGGQNLSGDGVGKYPDQAWVGGSQLKQVSSQAAVTAGKFYVDRTAKRIYLAASDVSKGGVEASDKNVFMSISAANTVLRGLTITRYSNGGADYGIINITGNADSSLLQDDVISDAAFISVAYQGNSNTNANGTMRNVTVTSSNWMGVSATYTDNLTLDGVKLVNMNQFNEFTYSPQSGGLKTSRTTFTKVINSDISNNKSHGLWFDQSNYHVEVANNTILDNAGSGMFFEISDNLWLVNNYIRSTGGARAVKLAGSSGMNLINNTIIGGADPIGVYVDNRSLPGCSDPARALCAGSYNSDRDSVRAHRATMTWVPSIDIMINNIVAYPTAAGYCGTTTGLCITSSNATAKVGLNTVIHKAAGGRPLTQMNGNVYANGSGKIINTASGNFTTTAAFMNAMAGAPVGIGGIESAGLSGNTYVAADGKPTAALTAVHSKAVAIPGNATINQYVAAGTRHYGVTYK